MRRDTVRSSDGTLLASYQWAPSGTVRGDVVLVHGVGEHLGRYEHVATALTEHGYRVRGVDFRGHGQSEGKRGHITRFERYVDDLRTAIGLRPGPHAIFAHSMGTAVSLDHLRDASCWALAASGLAVGIGVEAPGWKLAGARVLSRLLPGLSMDNEIPLENICANEQVRRDYQADPLVFSTITPRWFTEFLAAHERIHAAAPRYEVPALFAYGTDDRIVSIEAIHRFAEHYGAERTLTPYPGMRHEILNEIERDRVIADFLRFLDAHNPGDAA